MLKKLSIISLALLSGLVHAQTTKPDAELNAIAAKMKLRHIEIDKIQRLSPHLVELSIKGERVYTTSDGDIMLFGQAIQFDKDQRPTNLTTAAYWDRVAEMADDGRAIVYKAPKEKAKLSVFTDVTCGYCQKLHSQIPELNANGVTVIYVAYPRSGPDTPSFNNMRAAWCAKNPQESLSALFIGAQVPGASCAKAEGVNAGWSLGQQVGVQGTPTLMIPGGQVFTGYRSATDIIKLLGVNG